MREAATELADAVAGVDDSALEPTVRALVLRLRGTLSESPDDMRARHTNME